MLFSLPTQFLNLFSSTCILVSQEPETKSLNLQYQISHLIDSAFALYYKHLHLYSFNKDVPPNEYQIKKPQCHVTAPIYYYPLQNTYLSPQQEHNTLMLNSIRTTHNSHYKKLQPLAARLILFAIPNSTPLLRLLSSS